MNSEAPSLPDQIVALLPKLMRFALKMVRAHREDAEDLCHDTLVKALANLDKFDGQSLSSWLYIMMRGLWIDRWRKRVRETDDPDGELAASLRVEPVQDIRLHVDDLGNAMEKLMPIHRSALMLSAIEDLSGEDNRAA